MESGRNWQESGMKRYLIPYSSHFLRVEWDVTRFWGRRAGIDLENNAQKKAVFFIQSLVLGLFLEVSEVCEGYEVRGPSKKNVRRKTYAQRTGTGNVRRKETKHGPAGESRGTDSRGRAPQD